MACLCIDYREAALIAALETYDFAKIKKENLPLGDAVFRLEDSPPLWIVERKTVKDLEQSVKDGRYREQKARLLSQYPAHHVLYVIEGKVTFDTTTPQHNKMITGCILNTMLRDGMHVIQTANVQETAHLLMDMAQRLSKDPDMYKDKNTNVNATTDANDYISSIKLQKKENITPDVCAILQLATIPGLSTVKATAIFEHFGVTRLCQLANALSVPDGGGGAKKLLQVPGVGKVLAKTIINFLCA